MKPLYCSKSKYMKSPYIDLVNLVNCNVFLVFPSILLKFIKIFIFFLNYKIQIFFLSLVQHKTA